jgi:hypothetical protein
VSDTGGERPGEPIGGVGEEAAKLLAALSGWARDQGVDYAGSATGAAAAMSEAAHNLNEHIATGSGDCRYCPLCQVIHAVRSTSPEVREHLAVAASSLMHAAAGVLATQVPPDKRSPVEKIDLDDSDWDES